MMLHSTSTYDGNLYYSLMYKKQNGLYDTVHLHKNLPVTLPDVMKNGDNAIDVKENLTVMRKCYGTGFWIATTIRFSGNDNDYYVAIISIEDTGFQLIDTFYIEEYNDGIFGQGRFSPDGTKYATFNHVFDFDRVTGKLSFKYKLPFPDMDAYSIYGMTFSPNSRYLYWIGEDESTNNIYTYRIDLSLNNPLSAIQQIGEAPNNDFYHGMQIGPDGRIYIANDGHDELYVINKPDADWDGSDNPTGYIPFGVSLKVGEGAGAVGGTSKKGLPNHIDAKKAELVHDTIYFTVKNCRTVEFSTTACCRSTYRWEFGDGSSQNDIKKAEHTYSHAGVYEVLLILDGNDTVKVKVPLFNPKVRLLGDTLLCNQNQYATYTALELDSFTKNYKLEWEIKDGSYSNHHSMGNTIVPNFAALPAQVIVHVIDPGSECTASDTLTVNQIAELQVNQINYGINEVIICNPIDTFNLSGTEPDGSDFYYSWYYSLNNEDWHDMEVYTQNLPSQQLNNTIYLKRLVYPDACENWSNVVKVAPAIQNNNIYPAFPVCSEQFNYSKLRSDTVFIKGDYGSDFYYYKWQVSTNGHTWTDVEPYKFSIGSGGWDWWYNPFTYDLYFTEEPVMHVRKAVMSSICVDYSNVVKITNYNLEEVSGIEVNPFDNTLATGGSLIGNDSLITVTWQHSCDGVDWTDITTGYNNDTLFDIENYFPNLIRRKISKKDKNGNPIIGCEDVISYLEYGNIEMQPTNRFVAIGDSTTFSVSYNSMFTMKVQWQSFNEQEQEWFEMENENETQLTVTGDLCNDQRLFRAILSYGCFSVISDSATLSVHNPDSDYFIWLRDLPDDTAQEPNTLINNSNYLISPDIFVTHDPILPPLTWPYHYAINLDYNGAYIHVVVRNKGTDTSRGGKLFLYASISSSDPQWDFSFTNQVQFHFSPSWGGGITNQTIDQTNPFAMVTMGTQINEIGIDIPKIPPGGFDTITYHWDTPQNHFVVNSVQVPTLGWQTFVGKRSLVYLARIENCEEEPHGMTYSEDFFPAEPKSLYNNVRNNARIAALHSYKLPMKGPRMLIATALQVPDLWVPFDDKFNSPIELKLNTDSTDHFFNTGEVYIYFDQNLWDGFVAGGYQGSGYTIVADGIFKIDTLVPVHWDNISLAKDSIGYMGYSLHYKPGVVVPTTVVNQMFIVEIHQSGEMVGELFLHTQSQTDVEPAAFVEEESLLTQNSSFNTQNSLIFLANPNPFSDQLHIYIQAEENAVVKMYDMNGKVVATTEAFESGEKTFTINTAHLAEGVYFFRYRSGTQTIVKKVVLLR